MKHVKFDKKISLVGVDNFGFGEVVSGNIEKQSEPSIKENNFNSEFKAEMVRRIQNIKVARNPNLGDMQFIQHELNGEGKNSKYKSKWQLIF